MKDITVTIGASVSIELDNQQHQTKRRFVNMKQKRKKGRRGGREIGRN